MDLKREIKIVEAEVEEGTHNFDDIKLTLDKATVNIQVKNYKEGAKIRIEEGFIYYGSSKIKVSNTGNNILVTHNYQYEPKGLYYKRTEEQYITKATIIFLFTLSELKRKRVPQKSLKQC